MLSKKTVFIVIVIVVVLLAALGLLWWQSKNAVKAYEYNGLIEKVEDNSIFTKGSFVVSDRPELSGKRVTVEVVYDSAKTKLVKQVLYLPTAKELEKTGGAYNPSDLRKEEVGGSLDDLKSGQVDGIFTKSNRNIYNKSKFTASEIKYISAVYPAQ